MTTNAATLRAALLPRATTTTIDAALVVGAAAFIAVCAQVSIPLWFTPVPLTLQTFAVLTSAAALGSVRGGVATLLYVAAGAVGAPVYAGGHAGVAELAGTTGGYLAGMVAAAVLVGRLAERLGADRRVASSIAAMAVADVVILGLGMLWLAQVLDVSIGRAFALGVAPFLAVEAVKIAGAGLTLPALWAGLSRVVRRRARR